MSNTPGTALVVGAGVIGSASAFRLARDGWRVTVFDPAPGHGATWAAAGMIAPRGEIAPGEFENYRRQRDAVASWRSLSEELFEVTGQQVSIAQTGTLFVGFDGGDRQLVDHIAHVATDFGVAALRVSRETHESFFQGVTPRIRDGLYFEGDGWIDPDEAVRVLSLANETLGVKVIRETVTSASVEEQHVVVVTDGGSFEGDVGILATGAQPLPNGVAQFAEHAVRPVRGMTARVEGLDRSAQPALRAFVRGRSWYLVSRPHGYCVIGASSDEQGTLGVELGEAQRILRDSLDVVPSLETATLVEIREGLRPASKDLEPFVEVINERWAWLSGHYRHGMTLAPISSRDAVTFAQSFV
ncbi:MAG: FAD-dependent oxidoreductase [Acidimicrobiales bacterium]